MPKNMPVIDRLIQKVHIPDDPAQCWEWQASRDRDGYGRFQEPTPNGQRSIRAHRWFYEYLFGAIPADKVVMHVCDNPPCINPEHLRLGTDLDNNADKVAKGRHARLWGTPLRRSRQTHCYRGHPLAGDNLRIIRGYRRCKACETINSRRHYRLKHGLPWSEPGGDGVGRGQ